MKGRYWIVVGLGTLVAACHGQQDRTKPPAVAAIPLGWDANGDFKATGSASEDYLKGSYPLEGEPGARAAWIGRSASVKFTAPVTGRNLVVSGWAPYSLHQRSGLKGPLEVTVRVNGADVATRRFTSDEFFDVRVPSADLAKVPTAGPITTVEIDTSHGLIPKQTLGGDDAREVSIKISKVQMVF